MNASNAQISERHQRVPALLDYFRRDVLSPDDGHSAMETGGRRELGLEPLQS